MDQHEELRALAQRAREVADLIHQEGWPRLGEFPDYVRTEMPTRGPDQVLRDIQSRLMAVASAIDAYLSAPRGGVR